MSANDFSSFDGETILVRSSRDNRNPPTALRGTFRVKTSVSGQHEAQVEVDLPEMFTAPAHRVVIPLDLVAIASLSRNPHTGQLACTVNYDFVGETQGRTHMSATRQNGRRPTAT